MTRVTSSNWHNTWKRRAQSHQRSSSLSVHLSALPAACWLAGMQHFCTSTPERWRQFASDCFPFPHVTATNSGGVKTRRQRQELEQLSTHTRTHPHTSEVLCQEAIFHCYCKRARALAPPMYSRSQPRREQVFCVCACASLCAYVCACAVVWGCHAAKRCRPSTSKLCRWGRCPRSGRGDSTEWNAASSWLDSPSIYKMLDYWRRAYK